MQSDGNAKLLVEEARQTIVVPSLLASVDIWVPSVRLPQRVFDNHHLQATAVLQPSIEQLEQRGGKSVFKHSVIERTAWLAGAFRRDYNVYALPAGRYRCGILFGQLGFRLEGAPDPFHLVLGGLHPPGGDHATGREIHKTTLLQLGTQVSQL